ncbi:LysR substrate-binding domain-containing protein [Variovorax paradoxus]|uniref:LysR substrate-binding domain-containing protein n=1 Tax=Variovorax paradoxus TaxID=34073 RepID=UPI0030D3F974
MVVVRDAALHCQRLSQQHPPDHRCGLQVVPALEYPSVAAAGALVAAGLGITALPRLALQLTRNDDLVTVPLQRPAMSRPIGLITRAGRSPSPVGRAFMDLLHSREASR